MSVKEAVKLGIKAIYHATHRDIGSGGFCRIYHIHKDGWTKVHDALDVNKLHWKFQEEKKGMEVENDNNLVEQFKKMSSFFFPILLIFSRSSMRSDACLISQIAKFQNLIYFN